MKKNQTKSKRTTRKTSQSIQIGQTLESNDLYLPHKKATKSKHRPVIVVDKNKREEMVIVPGSSKKTSHTTEYKKYGIKYYRHNIEIEDDEGKPIKVGPKFKKTEKCSKLPESEAVRIRNDVINHSRFASENRKKYKKFKNK